MPTPPVFFILGLCHAAALALIRSMTLFTLAQMDKSVNTSTMLPRSVKGGSCSTDRSFILQYNHEKAAPDGAAFLNELTICKVWAIKTVFY